MSKVYFTSDLHLGHKNLIVGLRGMTVEEHDSMIISNWNKTISKRDIVYLLGDVTMENHKLIYHYLSQLKGTIYVVAGNHDTTQCCKAISQMGIQILGNIVYKGFLLSHVPIAESTVDGFRGNIHGHVHIKISEDGQVIGQPIGDKYFNVNTELHGYTPIAFDKIVELLKPFKYE